MLDKNKNTIIFDFGNVLINLDFERFFLMFEEILNVDWSERKLPQPILNAVHKYDRGHISDEFLISAFQNYNSSADPGDIKKAWNSLIGAMPPKRFEMLNNLSVDYNLCILSNINNLHLNNIIKYFKKEYRLLDFEDKYFDRVFYSHIIGKRKPDEEIYKYVTEELEVDPNTILFIDDLPENIEAAKSNGWHGHVHNPNDEIVDKIDQYLKTSYVKR